MWLPRNTAGRTRSKTHSRSTRSPASRPEQSRRSARTKTSHLPRPPRAQQVRAEQPPQPQPVRGQQQPRAMARLSPRGGRLLPSKAGARAEAWGLGARRLTVRSLSVPPLWFSRQVYTVEPGAGGRCRVREPLGPAAPQHSPAHARLRNHVTGCPQKARQRSEAATTQRPREGRAGHPGPPSPEEGGS